MKLNILLSVFYLITLYSYCQSPNLEWARCYGGTTGEMGNSVIQTFDGNYVIAGNARSDDYDLSGCAASSNNERIWLFKIDNYGDTLWMTCYLPLSRADCIIQDADSNLLVCGMIYTLNQNRNFGIIKLNVNGDTIWTKTYGGSNTEEALSIIHTHYGSYLVTGYSNSSDGDISFNHGNSDIWVINLDYQGNLLWEKSFGGTLYDGASSIIQTNDSCYVISGTSDSDNGDVHNNHGSQDYFMIKIDVNGDTLMTKCLGGSDNDSAKSLKQTSDNGYIIAGLTESNNGDVSGNNGLSDSWIVKTDSVFNIEWQKCYGGIEYEWAEDIQITNDGGYIVGASLRSSILSNFHGISDFWVLKLNYLGDTLWTKCLGGSDFDYLQSIQQLDNNGFIAAGFTYSKDMDVLNNHSDSTTCWIVKLEPDITSKKRISLNSDPIVYPNPAEDFIIVNLEKFESVEVVSVLGRKYYLTIHSNKLDISSLPKGIYLIQIKTEKTVCNSKFIKK